MTADHDGPVFTAPWQARAFALAVALREGGHLSWPSFQRHVAERTAADPDQSPDYYEHWLAALETFADQTD